MASNIAERLIAFRKDRKLTQDEVAALLDTTQQTIANWESGTMPRPMALAGVLAMLNGDAPAAPVVGSRSGATPLQVAFLDKAQELVDTGKLDDAACVELLSSLAKYF